MTLAFSVLNSGKALIALQISLVCQLNTMNAGREIAPNTGANATKFFTLATKS